MESKIIDAGSHVSSKMLLANSTLFHNGTIDNNKPGCLKACRMNHFGFGIFYR
jgi:hypothetical protein